MSTVRAAWAVYVKEVVDALRDRRTLMVVLVSSVLMGPLLLVALSALLASFEAGAEGRVVYVAGAERAPGLVNFLERQTRTVKPPPAAKGAPSPPAVKGAPAPKSPPAPKTVVVKRREDWIDLTWALINSPEFLYRH